MNTQNFTCRNCGDPIPYLQVMNHLYRHYRREAVRSSLEWEREGRRGVPRSIRAWHRLCGFADGKCDRRGKIYAEMS